MVAAAALVVLMTAWWGGLYAHSHGRLVMVALLACLPALASLAPRATRVAVGAALVVMVLGVAALATRASLGQLVGLSWDGWREVLRLVPEGISGADTAATPADAARDPDFVALLDLSLAALTGAIAWLVVARRRPGAAVAVAGVGLAYRWTVEGPDSPVMGGSMALAVMLAALAVAGRPVAPPRTGRATRVVLAVGSLMLAAAVLGSGQVQGDRGWWDWRSWSVSGASGQVGSLDIEQRYGQLRWPATARVVMRVRTPRPLPLRAAALTLFDGTAFTTDPFPSSTPLTGNGTTVFVSPRRDGDPAPVSQRISLKRTRSSLVMAGGRITTMQGPFGGRADLLPGDNVLVSPALGPNSSYQVAVDVPDPDPATLLAATAYGTTEVPLNSTELRAGPAATAVDVPEWGTGGAAPTAAQLGPYYRVYTLAASVTRGARSPYAAVNRVETYLRENYTYNEAPALPQAGTPPLVDFLFTTRQGFCQHFAGSMALMLRTLGIPSRVVVGYTPGQLDPDSGEWVVLDRDAHSWVEALLPGAGWVSFDPTPGRYAPNRVSVGSPDYSPPPSDDPAAPEVAPAPVNVPEDAAPTTTTPRPETPTPAPSSEPVDTTATDTGLDRTALAALGLAGLLALVVVVPPLVRVVRRLVGRRRGDARRRVLAALRDVEATLAGLGVAPPAHLDAAGRAAALRRATSVDAADLYAVAERARYRREGVTADDARHAWTEARRIRRQVRRRTAARRRLMAWFGMGRHRDTGAATGKLG